MAGLDKKDWVSIFESMDGLDVNLKRSKLEASGIESNTFNHQDSMLKSLNDTDLMVSLYVHIKDEAKAREIISNN
ncbi:MAG: putative signal transducing protein [Salibacteraceae bacterium]